MVTRWYRPGEVPGTSEPVAYDSSIDIWSAGCVMAEYFTGEILLRGTDHIDQQKKISEFLKKKEEILRGGKFSALDSSFVDLLSGIFQEDPHLRPNGHRAMRQLETNYHIIVDLKRQLDDLDESEEPDKAKELGDKN